MEVIWIIYWIQFLVVNPFSYLSEDVLEGIDPSESSIESSPSLLKECWKSSGVSPSYEMNGGDSFSFAVQNRFHYLGVVEVLRRWRLK